MIGRFVLSLSGRDKGRIHVVVSADAEKDMICICDGKTRRVEKPKPKKLKHVKFLSGRDAALDRAMAEGSLTNRIVKEAVARQEMTESRRDCSAEG